jgi:uncharacterized protein with ATP-grasp and redox domains
MKIQTQCVPCLLKRILFEADLSTNDSKVKSKVIRNVCSKFSEIYDTSKSSAEIATIVHKLAYDLLGDKDPYYDLKKQSNNAALLLIPRVEKLIKNSNDPLKTCIICSIAGNNMDFGIEGASSHPDMLKDVFKKTISEGLKFDDTKKMKDILKNSKNVILFTDNCGEIVFDKILCREIKKFNSNLILSVVVKGEPILSDATIDDINDLDFYDYVDNVFTTGCFAVGVDFKKLPSDVLIALKNADFIICKGMANYESFSETSYKPIVYLLRTKCDAIANSMDLPLNSNIVKLYD